jgi:L-ribulose-5-phosphate 3-epimerase
MKLSLACWSLNRQFGRKKQPLRLLDMPKIARQRFGIEALELNNVFFADTRSKYLKDLKRRARSEGVKLLNIAVDESYDLCEGSWRGQHAVNAYAWWIPVAAELGCNAIRANSGGKDVKQFTNEHFKNCAEHFAELAERGRPYKIKILMENHGGLSADPERMLKVRKLSGNAFEFLPDFGNWPKEVNTYSALEKIMPHAHAVHAKVIDIKANGTHKDFDLGRCVQIAKSAGYDGYLGIEYHSWIGASDDEGVKRAKRELLKYI